MPDESMTPPHDSCAQDSLIEEGPVDQPTGDPAGCEAAGESPLPPAGSGPSE